MTGTVLHVDPDDETRATTGSALEDAGLTVTACADLETGLEALDTAPDCVVSEFDLPDGTGLDLLAAVRERTPDAGFVLFTDAAPDAVGTSALSGGVAEYVPKGSPNAHELLVDLLRHTVTFRSQTAYPLPDDESERVAAIDDYRPVLEAVQPAFDRLTSLASDLLDVPMTSIGIVDDREQAFLACYGIDFDAVPREDTACTYALLEPSVTTIPDLAEDPRTAGTEAIDAHGLRAYASANLVTPEGRVIGTLCAYDSVPRDWTDDDREHLRLLAAEAMETLELRRRLHEYGGPQAAERERTAVPAGASSDRSGTTPDDRNGGRR